ncbi:MAG: DUF4145 domain-containing protein [Thermoanaerobaculia bacterium]
MGEAIRCQCNRCGQETNHDVLHDRKETTTEHASDGSPLFWTNIYQMLACRGCDNVGFRHAIIDPSGGEDEVHLYPAPASRRFPVWRSRLPAEMGDLLEEVYAALHHDSRMLAMMGLRTVLDTLMLEQVGDQGSFEKKLDAMAAKGIISTRQGAILRAALDAGSAAAHRGFKPDAGHLTAVIDIAENLLQAVYHLRPLAEQLTQATPPRPPRESR